MSKHIKYVIYNAASISTSLNFAVVSKMLLTTAIASFTVLTLSAALKQ
jgi:hypothetical protein